MVRVSVSSVVNASVETVWKTIRDFNALPEWNPAIVKSEIENGEQADRIGCFRILELAGGGTIREQLLSLSDKDHAVTYSIISSPMPVDNYIATLSILPITDGNRCFLRWTAEFDVPAEHQVQTIETIGQGVFQTAFNALKQRYGG